MLSKKNLMEVTLDVIPEVNMMLPSEQQLDFSEEDCSTPILGIIDSMGLVNLILMLEQRLTELTGSTVILANDDIISDRGPLKNLGSLVDYLDAVINP